MIPRLAEGQTAPQFLGQQIRNFLDTLASSYEFSLNANPGLFAEDAEMDAQTLIDYIRNPANVTYTVPAHIPPPPPVTHVDPPV